MRDDSRVPASDFDMLQFVIMRTDRAENRTGDPHPMRKVRLGTSVSSTRADSYLTGVVCPRQRIIFELLKNTCVRQVALDKWSPLRLHKAASAHGNHLVLEPSSFLDFPNTRTRRTRLTAYGRDQRVP